MPFGLAARKILATGSLVRNAVAVASVVKGKTAATANKKGFGAFMQRPDIVKTMGILGVGSKVALGVSALKTIVSMGDEKKTGHTKEEIIKMLQKAYDKGHTDGLKEGRREVDQITKSPIDNKKKGPNSASAGSVENLGWGVNPLNEIL